jgi:TadE-like protein
MELLCETRRRSRRRGSAGQAIVEFAMITPVFFLVFFGILEFALITASIGSYDFATREGARMGSVLGRTDSNADNKIINVVLAHVQGIVMAKPQTVYIYDAEPAPQAAIPPAPTLECLNVTSGSADVAVGDPNCREDVFTIANGTATQTVNNWPPSARNDTEANADYLGVRVDYNYTYVTGFVAGLGSTLGLSTYSVQRIEPQDYSVRRAGAGSLAGVSPSGSLAEVRGAGGAWTRLEAVVTCRSAIAEEGCR